MGRKSKQTGTNQQYPTSGLTDFSRVEKNLCSETVSSGQDNPDLYEEVLDVKDNSA